ncbi:UNVERIFIED_CONTAM: hypothetical protein PYX00_007556 [Menopon gallinae]|uniref:Uncharacterized protein n=1 Tax=Menopon gallinae TaxID=328185 RepID=A0AAW2HJB9_9NEOP
MVISPTVIGCRGTQLEASLRGLREDFESAHNDYPGLIHYIHKQLKYVRHNTKDIIRTSTKRTLQEVRNNFFRGPIQRYIPTVLDDSQGFYGNSVDRQEREIEKVAATATGVSCFSSGRGNASPVSTKRDSTQTAPAEDMISRSHTVWFIHCTLLSYTICNYKYNEIITLDQQYKQSKYNKEVIGKSSLEYAKIEKVRRRGE